MTLKLVNSRDEKTLYECAGKASNRSAEIKLDDMVKSLAITVGEKVLSRGSSRRNAENEMAGDPLAFATHSATSVRILTPPDRPVKL